MKKQSEDQMETVIISYAEAKQIFNDGFPSFEDMIKNLKIRFSFPPEVWEDFDSVIQKRSCQSK